MVSMLTGGRSGSNVVVPAASQGSSDAVSARQKRNLEFLRSAQQKYMVLANAQGSGFSQNYTTASQLIWDVPKVQGGYLESILFKVNVVLNFATGTGATYQLNAGAPYSLFDYIIVEFGKQQVRIPALVLKWLAIQSGYEKAQPFQVNTGQSIAFDNTNFWNSPFAVAAGNNTWTFWLKLPLRLLARHVAGMIPIGPDSPKVQVKLNCCANGLMGTDPITNPTSALAGTGNAVTVSSGTVTAQGIYRDGVTKRGITPLTPDLTGEPTIQYYTDRVFNPLPAGALEKLPIDTKLQHLYAWCVVVDGNQSTKYAANSNIAAIELLKDSSGDSAFYRFGIQGNNVGVPEFFSQFRDKYGQDLDEGVLPLVFGPGLLSEPDPDNLDGLDALNMMGKQGYYDAQAQVQVTTVGGVPSITARLQWYLISINPAGLVAAQ